MSYYRVCPTCGAYLDPGEKCNCEKQKETALDAANIQDDKEDPINDRSSSSIEKKEEKSKYVQQRDQAV